MSQGWVDFQAVKQAVSLAAVLQWYGVRGLRRSGAQQLRGRCPVHGPGGEDAFHASLRKNAFRCFYCQTRGNVLDLVAALERCTVREAALRLAERFGVHAGGDRAAPAVELVPEKEAGENRPLKFQLRGIDPCHPYLVQRGMDALTAAHFGVGFYAGPGLLSGRVVIPIHNQQGSLVAYCGRSIDSRLPRYQMPAGFRKSLVLFNLHRAVASGRQTVVLVEGFFDCFRVHQAGFPCVMALMGASLSPAQQSLLLERFGRIVVLLDGDAAGRHATERIAARLAGKCTLIKAVVPAGEQPDRLSVQEIRRALAAAMIATNDGGSALLRPDYV